MRPVPTVGSRPLGLKRRAFPQLWRLPGRPGLLEGPVGLEGPARPLGLMRTPSPVRSRVPPW
nr:hypothetical protein StreXyl84_40300 [Streptomyces sp. Xyl84]